MKKKSIILLIVLVTVAGGFLFYWYELRPSYIKTNCVETAEAQAQNTIRQKAEMKGKGSKLEDTANRGLYLKGDYDSYYEKCLNEKGL